MSPQAAAYSEQITSPESGMLSTIAAQTYALHPHSHMLSGHVQGKFLEFISMLMRPLRVLELGTFTGYSAICLTKGLARGGLLHTIESRPADAATAAENFNLAGLGDKIILHTGEAAAIIPSIDETWDLVFVDADKTGYVDYYRLLLPKLRKGGLMIVDNVLFHGEVLDETIKGKNAKAIDAFNRMVSSDAAVQTVMLTVRDGLLLIMKN